MADTASYPLIPLDPEAFRELIHVNGEPIRWWKAMPNPAVSREFNVYDRAATPVLHEEQSLAEAVRAYLYQAQKTYLHPELGMVRTGEVIMASMPDEIGVGNLDKVMATSRKWRSEATLKRGTSDTLPYLPVIAIDRVQDVDHGQIDPDDYTVTSETGLITFSSTPGAAVPPVDALYTVIYYFQPTFWYLGDTQRGNRPGNVDWTSAMLPQYGKLSLTYPSADDN